VDVAEQKKHLRQQYIKVRHDLPASVRHGAGEKISSNFWYEFPFARFKVVASYVPFPDEMDIWPLTLRLMENEGRVCYPAMVEEDHPMIFREVERSKHQESIKAQLVKNTKHHFFEPIDELEEVTPDFILLPLVAFDRLGGRLGMGAGMYDRTLGNLFEQGRTPTTIGIAFESQRVEHVPTEPSDVMLDYIVTDDRLIKCAENRAK
jgi:5-formyltetrahydrofolate cyclo-ligase